MPRAWSCCSLREAFQSCSASNMQTSELHTVWSARCRSSGEHLSCAPFVRCELSGLGSSKVHAHLELPAKSRSCSRSLSSTHCFQANIAVDFHSFEQYGAHHGSGALGPTVFTMTPPLKLGACRGSAGCGGDVLHGEVGLHSLPARRVWAVCAVG